MLKLGVVLKGAEDIAEDEPTIEVDETAVKQAIADFEAVPSPKPPSAYLKLNASITTTIAPLVDTVWKQVQDLSSGS